MGKPLTYPIPRITGMRTLADMALDGADHRYWYDSAREQIGLAAQILVGEGHGTTPDRLCELLALFSPRVSVLRSSRFMLHYIRTRGYMPDVMRTVRASVEHWRITGEIRGPKTRPFADALKGDKSALVLDVWMGEALGVNPKRWEVRAVWDAGAKRIRQTARYLNWPVAETQAAIWAATVMRQPYGNVPAFNLIAELTASDIPT